MVKERVIWVPPINFPSKEPIPWLSNFHYDSRNDDDDDVNIHANFE